MQITFMKASVFRSATAPAGRATARSTSAADQIPCASSPSSATRLERVAERCPAGGGVERGRAPATEPARRASRGSRGRCRRRAAGRGIGRRCGAPRTRARGPRRRSRSSRRGRRGRAGARRARPSGRRPRVACVGRFAAKRSSSERSRVTRASASPPACRERALGELQGAHAMPTSTSRKRAGAQPCETRMSCPGSPLPQSSSEISRHSEGEQTASQPPQNRGVTPA